MEVEWGKSYLSRQGEKTKKGYVIVDNIYI